MRRSRSWAGVCEGPRAGDCARAALPTIDSMHSFDVQVRGAGHRRHDAWRSRWRGSGLSVALRGAPARGARPRRRARLCAQRRLGGAAARPEGLGRAARRRARRRSTTCTCEGDAGGAALEFSAWEQRVGELAWIVDAAALERELAAALRFAPHVDAWSTTDVAADADRAVRRQGLGHARALGVGIARAATTASSAIAARLVATRPHAGVARQWFRSPDVLALLPFDRPEPERSYALVWSLPTERAEALLALDAAAFEHALAHATGGAAGDAAPRLRARRLAADARRAPTPGAARAGCCSATPRTSCIRWPARA